MAGEIWALDLQAAESWIIKASLAAGPGPARGPGSYRIGDTAIVNVTGILTSHGGGIFDLLFGGSSYDSIRAAVTGALEDPPVRSILLTVQSPGGEASGLPDLLAFLRQARQTKPIAAFAEMALSAAYAIASTASPGGFYVSQDAATGSIGAIALHLDRSRQLEQEGLAVTHFTAGRRKADMSPFKPLSGAGAQAVQHMVDHSYELLVVGVGANRPALGEMGARMTEAAIYHGAEGVAAGLADSVLSVDQLGTALSQGRRAGGVMSPGAIRLAPSWARVY
jgi:ClpP class serine protease